MRLRKEEDKVPSGHVRRERQLKSYSGSLREEDVKGPDLVQVLYRQRSMCCLYQFRLSVAACQVVK
jgi:hypothetical protein